TETNPHPSPGRSREPATSLTRAVRPFRLPRSAGIDIVIGLRAPRRIDVHLLVPAQPHRLGRAVTRLSDEIRLLDHRLEVDLLLIKLWVLFRGHGTLLFCLTHHTL